MVSDQLIAPAEETSEASTECYNLVCGSKCKNHRLKFVLLKQSVRLDLVVEGCRSQAQQLRCARLVAAR